MMKHNLLLALPMMASAAADAVEKAAGLGMKLCLYDEFSFPGGPAGGGPAQDDKLVWNAPAGDWQVMLYTCGATVAQETPLRTWMGVRPRRRWKS